MVQDSLVVQVTKTLAWVYSHLYIECVGVRDSQLGECPKKAHIQVLSIRVTAYLDKLAIRLNQRESNLILLYHLWGFKYIYQQVSLLERVWIKRLGKGWVSFPNEPCFHSEYLLI